MMVVLLHPASPPILRSGADFFLSIGAEIPIGSTSVPGKLDRLAVICGKDRLSQLDSQ